MAERIWRKTMPLALAALLMLGGCDEDEEPEKKIVEIEVDKDAEIQIKVKSKDEMIIVGELALFSVFVVWALFGPGAKRRREMPVSESR